VSVHQAHLWGIKAAQEGIPISCNPYRNPQARAAWEAGHRKDIFAPRMHRVAWSMD
jgi:ribosome modulation factor